MNIIIEIAQEFKDWDKYPELNTNCIREVLKRILSRYPNFSKIKQVELSILLTCDQKMQSLNNEFRKQNKATNILSFPDIEIDWRKIVEFEVNHDYMYLGDIAFGYQTIENEAISKSISFNDHFKHLLVHAILHLLGYDHMNDEEATVMEDIEVEILGSFAIKSPY